MRPELMQLDTAEERALTVEGNTQPEENFKAVWNVDKNKLAAVVHKGYNVVQHREVAEAMLEATERLNVKTIA